MKKTFNKFKAHVTRLKQSENGDEPAIYGLIGETGEVVDLIKKYKFHGHELDEKKLIEECGDALFYWFWYVDPDFAIFDQFAGVKGIFDPIKSKDIPLDVFLSFAIWDIIHTYELNVYDIMRVNIEKLNKRYSTGKFRMSDSINRKE